MGEKQQSTSKSFLMLSAITIVEKIIGFLYQAVIAAAIGANIITDCYFSTFELLTLVDYSIISAMAVALLKQYTALLVNNEEAGVSFLSNVRSVVMPIVMLLSATIFALAKPLTYILAPSYNDAERSMLEQNIHWMSFVPLLLAFVTFYLVILRQECKFGIVGLKSLFINIVGFVAIGAFLIIKPDNSIVLCLGYNTAMLVYCLVAYLSTRKTRKLNWVKPKIDVNVKNFALMWMPLIISNGIVRISLMVDRVISTTVGEGGVTCLTYSQMLFYFIEGLFVTNISIILLSDFTNLVAQNDSDKINFKINNAVATMIIILIPITVISIIYNYDIVMIVFGHGKFKGDNIGRVADLLMYYAVGFVPSVISNIFRQVQYSLGKAQVAMMISIVSIGVNIASSLVFVQYMGLSGVALGTAVSYFISGTLNYIYASRNLKGYKSVFSLRFCLRIIVSSALCVGTVHVLHKTISINPIISFVTATVIGSSVFLGILWLMKEPAINNLGTIVKRILPKR